MYISEESLSVRSSCMDYTMWAVVRALLRAPGETVASLAGSMLCNAMRAPGIEMDKRLWIGRQTIANCRLVISQSAHLHRTLRHSTAVAITSSISNSKVQVEL